MNKTALVLSTATLLLGSVAFSTARDRDGGVSRSAPGNGTQPGASQNTGHLDQDERELQRHRGDRDTSRTDNTLGTVQQEEMDGD